MTKRLFLQGHTITPIVHAIDIEAGTVEQVGMNPVSVGPDEGAAWFTETWPGNWERLRTDYVESEKSRETAEANEQATVKRAVRKAPRKVPAKSAGARKRAR